MKNRDCDQPRALGCKRYHRSLKTIREGTQVSDAERFRRLAGQYEKLAAGTSDPRERDQHLKLARTWNTFARQAELRPVRIRPKPAHSRTTD
jgi:hypothetical protein